MNNIADLKRSVAFLKWHTQASRDARANFEAWRDSEAGKAAILKHEVKESNDIFLSENGGS